METKGIVLLVWGKRGYGFMAYNLAVSIKFHSPNLPIHLVATKESISQVGDFSAFDSIEWIESSPIDPGRFKAYLYSRLPFDYNLYLDVDALCLQPLEPLIDSLVESGNHYATYIHTVYDNSSENEMPQMYWAYREDIWSHYQLSNHRLPATQSSIQFIKKCDESKNLFETMERCFDNPIPLERLKNRWGGGQPDELYLNVAMALTACENHIGNESIYFGNSNAKNPSQVEKEHYLLSFFGSTAMIRKAYWDYYDNKLIKIFASRGQRHNFKRDSLRSDKIANIKVSPLKEMLPMKVIETRTIKRKGTMVLLTSYYHPRESSRKRELDSVFERNINCDSIDRIVNLGVPYHHPKVVNLDYARPTYADFMKEAAKLMEDYKIIANADIFFTHEIERIKDLNLEGKAVCLSRYDVDRKGNAKLFDYEWSQDTWIFKGHIPDVNNLDFIMGLPACDNRFAYELAMVGIEPINPSKSIRTYHLHLEGKRTYNESMRLKGDVLAVVPVDDSQYLKPRLLINQPGKVGDIIICLPIAKWYFEKGYLAEFKCPDKYHHLFTGVDYCVPIAQPSGYYHHSIDLAFGLETTSRVHEVWVKRKRTLSSFVELKYELAGVPISQARNLEYRRDKAKELALMCQVVHCFPYKLAHVESDYGGGIEVDGEDVVYFKPVEGYSIFDWRLVIEKASEIHCIDSSLANFVDCLNVKADLFYYPNDKVPELADRTILTKKWEVREYANS